MVNCTSCFGTDGWKVMKFDLFYIIVLSNELECQRPYPFFLHALFYFVFHNYGMICSGLSMNLC